MPSINRYAGNHAGLMKLKVVSDHNGASLGETSDKVPFIRL